MKTKELIVSPIYNAKGNIVGQEYHGELIRCKDCKHAEHEDDGDIMCTFWDFCECNHHVLGNGYCDRAEPKEKP